MLFLNHQDIIYPKAIHCMVGATLIVYLFKRISPGRITEKDFLSNHFMRV